MSVIATASRWWNNLFVGTSARTADTTRATFADSRATNYEINEALYNNTLYDTYLSQVLSTNFTNINPENMKFTIRGFTNPVKQIVDAYQNCLPGTFGEGVTIDPMVDEQPVNPKLAGPVRQVWRDSGMDTQKTTVQRHAANLGTVGLRPTRVGDKVLIQVDHPSRIFNLEKDGQGNITAATLKYQIQRNEGTRTAPDYVTAEVVQEFTKEEFSYTINGKQQLTERRNHYGFCPYVTLLHRDNGTDYGDWAYKGSESIFHAINYRITQQDRSIARLMFPKWFGGAAGDKPTQIDAGGEKMTYVKLSNDGPQPFLQAIVPQIDNTAGMAFWLELIAQLKRRHPEMLLAELTLEANTSGETLMHVLKQVEAAILLVRPAYDHAFIRALQMCLSIGSVDSLPNFDIGAGLGEGSGDKAYESGLESFQFSARPALPLTPAQQQEIAKASVADRGARFSLAKQAQGLGVSDDEVLRLAGYTVKQIEEIRGEKRTKDVVPSVGL